MNPSKKINIIKINRYMVVNAITGAVQIVHANSELEANKVALNLFSTIGGIKNNAITNV